MMIQKEWENSREGLSRERMAMPRVLTTGPYRFYFYSHESQEPPYIHVDRDDLSAILAGTG